MALTNRQKPRWGAYLIGAYLFSVPAFGYSDSGGLLIIPQVTGALLVCFALYDLLGRLRISVPGEIGLYALMGLWAGVTFFFRSGATPEDMEGLLTLAKVVLTTLACAQLIKDEEDLFIALKIFAFSVLFVYFQNSGELRWMRIMSNITEDDRFAGTLTNANTAAIYSLTVVWGTLVLLLRARFAPIKFAAYVPSLGASLLIIYYSGSKKGLMGLALMAVFVVRLLYIRQREKVWQKALIVGISIVLVLVVGYFIYTSPFFFRMQQLFSGISNASDANRLLLAKEAIGVWLTDTRTFFMGVGFGQFWKYSSLGTYAHSTPLELLASNGLVGFSLFMGFLALLWRTFLQVLRRTSDKETRSLVFAVMIFPLIYTFFMMASVLHESRELVPILGCLAAFGRYHLRRAGSGPAGAGGLEALGE